VYDTHTFDLAFPLGSRPYLVPLAEQTPSPFGPLPGGRPLGPDNGVDPAAEARPARGGPPRGASPPAAAGPNPPGPRVTVDPAGLAGRVVALPVEEARYSSL